MNIFQDLYRLFFPPTCPVCGKLLMEGDSTICNKCRWDIPLTGFCAVKDNPVREKISGLLPVINASSLFYHIEKSEFRNIIHRMKYQGSWRLAESMGEWLGGELKHSGNYDDIDVIIPVPLHVFRKFKRGYNQAEHIGNGISKMLSVPVLTGAVRRTRHTTSQTKQDKAERWQNVKDIFKVTEPVSLAGKHILIVDDVLTTGATLVSCCQSIIRSVPDCRISVVTLSVSKVELERSMK